MSQVQEIKIQLEGISSALKTRRFRVPAYQRSYAWESEHVMALLNDVSDAIRNKESEYFLGSIVVTGPHDQRFEVVDGQQRLTTISLLIAAIKDVFLQAGDHDVVSSVKTDFLASTDRKTKEKEPKLTLNEVDNELYQELIEGIKSVDRARFVRQSQKRLIEAANTIHDYVDSQCKSSKDSEELLHSWLDYLESNLKIIIVTTPDDSNAFVIFETLNDRGLELAISDLLKNYLFHKSGDKIEETKNRWMSMVAILEAATEDQMIVTYIRHFAMSSQGLIREKDLFNTIKRKITSKKAVLQFSTDLSDTAKIYSALINTDHEYWAKYDPSVREHVANLNVLGMTQIRPLLLAILKNFNPAQVKETFRKLEAAAVRLQIVGGIGGSTLESNYSKAAKTISDGTAKNSKDVIETFTTLPPDAAFMQAFSIASISRPALARFYLRKLEIAASQKSTGKQQVPNPDTSEVNLEHILPLTLNDTWLKSWNQEDARAYQRRLGNLAILGSKQNSKSGNESFSVKKKSYANSAFLLTSRVANESSWNKNTIESRQQVMAEIAVKIWTLK